MAASQSRLSVSLCKSSEEPILTTSRAASFIASMGVLISALPQRVPARFMVKSAAIIVARAINMGHQTVE